MRTELKVWQHNRLDANSCFSKTLANKKNAIFWGSNKKFKDGGQVEAQDFFTS